MLPSLLSVLELSYLKLEARDRLILLSYLLCSFFSGCCWKWNAGNEKQNKSRYPPSVVITKIPANKRDLKILMIGIILFYFFFNFYFFISWRLITLQYCSGFCHKLKWISHGFTCVPHPDPPSHFTLQHDPSGSSQCTRPEHMSHASNLGWQSVSP